MSYASSRAAKVTDSCDLRGSLCPPQLHQVQPRRGGSVYLPGRPPSSGRPRPSGLCLFWPSSFRHLRSRPTCTPLSLSGSRTNRRKKVSFRGSTCGSVAPAFPPSSTTSEPPTKQRIPFRTFSALLAGPGSSWGFKNKKQNGNKLRSHKQQNLSTNFCSESW